MAQQPVFAVLEKVSSIAADEVKYLCGVSEKLDSAKKQLLRMHAFLMDLDDKMMRGGAMARNLASEVREVAYEVENIIDDANILRRQSDPNTSIRGAIYKYTCFLVYLTHVHKLGVRVDSATARMKTIFEDFERHNIVATAIGEEPWVYSIEDEAVQHWRSVQPDSSEHVNVIGFSDQIEKIKDDLLDGGNKDLTVLSIVGPGGAGKSTMAKEVYGLAAVKRHFEVHAWKTVSQRFVLRDLLKELVNRNMGPQHAEGLETKNVDELKKLLHDSLISKKYLIVLDDVWSTTAWDIIRGAFPDKKNGSRIILTTRNEAIAQHPSARRKIYKPKLLNEEESTLLLLNTALPEYILDGSSNNSAAMRKTLYMLKELGKDLAVKCCGLPLAIIVLGGHLSRNRDVVEWSRLTRSMDWHALITTERVIGAILDLSYYDMPSHLRSCFTYTTAFPEDSTIDVTVLTSLWVAEGFIPLVRGHTREEVAFKYVTELVQRCMIQVEKKAPSGRIMLIKVHDILRDWGIGRARREGFMKDCHVAEDAETAYSDEIMEAYRVVLHGKAWKVGTCFFEEKKVRASMRPLRTLLDFRLSYEAVMANSLQNLRVLYVHYSDRSVLWEEIGRMRYLRYLGLGGTGSYTLPSSIGRLLSLETFYATGYVIHIPGVLWKIPTMRQVYACHAESWSLPHFSSESKLQVMVLGTARSNYQENQAMRMMEETKRKVSKNKNRNISCCFGMIYAYHIYQMDIIGRCKEGTQSPCDLSNIKGWDNITVLKICCSNLLKMDQEILELGKMSVLRVLEIGEQSYAGSVMTFPSGSFPHLERLLLHNLAVDSWKTEDDSVELLKELKLCRCPNLVNLPKRLPELLHLVKVDLVAMPLGCQQGTVAQELRKKKGCVVFVSSNEKDFQHLNVP